MKLKTNSDFYDVTVIGGGPVGMFAAFYAGLRDAKVQIIESLASFGGQVSALYPYKTILDVGGYAGISGKQLVAKLSRQLKTMHPDVKLHQTVIDVQPVSGGYRIVTDRSVTKTKAIVIACGNGAFNPRHLMAKGASQLTGQRLFYSVTDLNRFKDRTVLVAGGGNSAIDNALLLEKVARRVYLLHRRNSFRGLEKMVDRLKQSQVRLITPYLIRQLDLTKDGKILITAKKMRTQDDLKKVKVDDVVVNYGFIASDRTLRRWHVKLAEAHRRIKTNVQLQTNLPNVYAVGDAAVYPGKDTLIATGLGEVPVAVNSIMRHLYPRRRMPLHSTMLKWLM